MERPRAQRPSLHPTADPNANAARSAIPVVSAMKSLKPPGGGAIRMSLAGPAQRAPQQPPSLPRQSLMPGGGSSGGSTNPRMSMMRSQNNPLLQSVSKPSTNFRTPLNSSTRRGSMWSGGAAPPMPSSSQTKETRPLRDKQFQSQMKTEIVNFLRLRPEYENVSVQMLNGITGKGYKGIVDCLTNILDPNYPTNPMAKLEDDLIPTLRVLHYPFVDAIDRRWLAAPASMHSWPTLLGVLHWMVEACRALEAYTTSGDPTLQDPESVPEEFEEHWDHHALAFDYYDQAYALWLDMQDDFVEPNQYLEERYARKNEQAQVDLDEKTKTLEQGQAELKKLQSTAPPLAQLQDERLLLRTDHEKFLRILAQFETRKNKLLDQIATEKAELVSRGEQLERMKADQIQLEEKIKEQNLTREEAIQLTTDHDSLQANVRDLKHKITETHQAVMNNEVAVARRISAVEEALDTYTGLLTRLDLYPSPAPPLPTVPLTLELNPAAANPQHLLIGDIRGSIKPCLNQVAESKRLERNTVENDRLKFDNDLEHLRLECENVEEEIGHLEKKVMALNDQADELREVTQQEVNVSSKEVERLGRELNQARTTALTNGMGVRSRLQALQIEYDEQVARVARLRDETVQAIIKNTTDITNFKAAVSSHLAELAACANAEE
ncbi:putative kinetochore protein NDC80 [Mycena kentingensis (nom. inval.)]|nr:putative kinetochore protein NDC80 [Mycena kentingensis (nom. inval.)]